MYRQIAANRFRRTGDPRASSTSGDELGLRPSRPHPHQSQRFRNGHQYQNAATNLTNAGQSTEPVSCEWDGCDALLDNADKLWHHVQRAHVKTSELTGVSLCLNQQ